MMGLLQRLLKKPLEDIGQDFNRKVAVATAIAIREALETVDETSPVMGDLLAGNEVEIVAVVDPIKVRIQLREVHKGAAFTGPKP